jgi:hypothetical protein
MTKTEAFLKKHPVCCFCGGATQSTTIDHQPAKIIFPNKHRPKGLEFPACIHCNRQSSADEALLALLCRIAGSLRFNATTDIKRLKDIQGTVASSFPNLLQKMKVGPKLINRRGVLVRGGAIDVNQPEVDMSLCRVAAKLALAIYYETQSLPAVKDCWINTYWAHSHNAQTFADVNNLIQAMPAQATLQMGRWNTEDSFFLKYLYEDGQLSLAAIFHESIALIACLCEPQVPRGEKWQFTWSPQSGTGITISPSV